MSRGLLAWLTKKLPEETASGHNLSWSSVEMVLEGYRSNAPRLMLLKEPVDIISRCFLDNDWNIKLHPSFPQGFFVHDILCMTACQAQGKWCRPKPKQVLCSVSTALPLALVSAEADFESQIRTARPWKIRSFTARNWRAETAEWPWNKSKLTHSKVPFHPLSLFQRLNFRDTPGKRKVDWHVGPMYTVDFWWLDVSLDQAVDRFWAVESTQSSTKWLKQSSLMYLPSRSLVN